MFLSGVKADLGGDRSPLGSFWFEPVGMRSSTGLSVSSASAMRLSAVYSCVRVLSETFAVLPFKLYRMRADGGRDVVTDHWIYRLFSKRPNGFQSPFEWREMIQAHLCLRGNAFNELTIDGNGQITDLVPIHPDRIKAQQLTNGDYCYLVTDLDGTQRRLSRGQVWHLRGLSNDGITGMNPIEIAADVLGLGIAAQTYGARFFANDAKPGGWLEMTGKFADNEAKEEFKRSWQEAQGGRNRGKTAVLQAGMKYHELSMNNNDAQFLETRKFSRSEIASLFRIPPHMIGDLEKATFSNIEQQSLDFVIHTMTPWAERWESSIESVLMLSDDADLEIEFDFANLLRGDSAARAAYYTSGINAGWLVRNEARIREGMNPIDGLDEPIIPLNMMTIDEAAEIETDSAKVTVQPIAPPAKPAPDARLVALLTGNVQRMARRSASGSPPTVAVLSDALQISTTAAETWLAIDNGIQQPENLLYASLMALALKDHP